MATIANWNGHTFEVSPSLIRGFSDLKIDGGCETTTKNSSKQKYEERKYGESPTISMTVHLNAQLGVTDVYSEAMELLAEATEGACDYFYLGSSKLVPAKLILTKASIAEIVHLPMSGDTWISCDVQLTFKQGTKNDSSSGSGSGGGGGKSKKASVKKSTASPTPVAGPTTQKGLGALLYGKNESYTAMINKSKETIKNGKSASASVSSGGLASQAQRLGIATKTSSSSSTKTSATTGRSTSSNGTSKLKQLKDRI